MTNSAFQGPCGGNGGNFFDDDAYVSQPITKLAAWFYNDSIITRFAVTYGGTTVNHGDHDWGVKEEMTLATGERIVSIEGTTNGDRVTSLEIKTDRGQHRLFGRPNGSNFYFGDLDGAYVAGFIGRCASDCDAIGVILKKA